MWRTMFDRLAASSNTMFDQNVGRFVKAKNQTELL